MDKVLTVEMYERNGKLVYDILDEEKMLYEGVTLKELKDYLDYVEKRDYEFSTAIEILDLVKRYQAGEEVQLGHEHRLNKNLELSTIFSGHLKNGSQFIFHLEEGRITIVDCNCNLKEFTI